MLHKECFLTCGSGRSGKSTASLAYTPSRDLKSGMPQETETPAPVNTMIRLEVPIQKKNMCWWFNVAIHSNPNDKKWRLPNLFKCINILISRTTSSSVLTLGSFFRLGGSATMFKTIFHNVNWSRWSEIKSNVTLSEYTY